MFCKNCGTQLTGTEAVCPNCGSPVVQDANVNTAQPEMIQPNSQPTMMPNNNQPMTPNTPQMMNTSNPGMQPGTGSMPANGVGAPTNPVQNQTPANGGNKTTIMLVVALVAVVVIAVGVFFFLSNKQDSAKPAANEPSSKDSSTETPKTDPVGTNTSNTVTFGAYTFTLPDGYIYETADNILAIANADDTFAFSITLDYTNSFEAYRQYYAQKYPSIINDAAVTIGSRNYIIFAITDEQGNNVSQYVTSMQSGGTFVGIVAHADNSQVTTADYQIVTAVLDSAKSSGTFAAGNDDDAGKNGIIDYDHKKTGIVFKK